MWRYFSFLFLLIGLLNVASGGQQELDESLDSTQKQVFCWVKQTLKQANKSTDKKNKPVVEEKAQSAAEAVADAAMATEQAAGQAVDANKDGLCPADYPFSDPTDLERIFADADYINTEGLISLWLGNIKDPEKIPQQPQNPEFWESFELALAAIEDSNDNINSKNFDEFVLQRIKTFRAQLAWYYYRNADKGKQTLALNKEELLQLVFYRLANADTDFSEGNFFELYQENKTNLPDLSEVSSIFPTLDANYGLIVEETSLNNDSDKPTACLVFNRNLAKAPTQTIEDFLVIDNKAIKTELSGNRLCFDNIGWESKFAVNIKPGLLTEDGIVLLSEINKEIEIGGREPMLRFHNQGKVLSAFDSKNIAVDYAKLASADLKLMRINPRNINKTNWLLNEATLRNYRVNDFADEDGELLVDANIRFLEDNASLSNDTDTVNIDLDELNTSLHPGVYLLALRANLIDAESGEEYNADYWVSQALVISDVGMSSIQTPQHLLIEVRDLQSFAIKPEAEIQLIAKNNEVLASKKTDAEGLVRFEFAEISGEGGKRPAFVFYHDSVANHFAYIELEQADHDLSSYGLDGKYSTSVFETWNWTDRGVYRPGDHLKMLSLIRDKAGKLQDNLPIWIKLYRADGKLAVSRKLDNDSSGAYLFEYDLAETARLGSWYIELSLGEKGEVFSRHNVLVDAIIPSQLEVAVNISNPMVQFNHAVTATVEGKWLYGANAGNISGEGYWVLRPRGEPFSEYKDWQVGLYQEDYYPEQNMLYYSTDAQGIAKLNFVIDPVQVSQPLELQISTGLRELSGEQTVANKAVKVERAAPYAAIKTSKDEAWLAVFDESQTLQNTKLHWAIKQVYYDGYWVKRDNGYWDYQSSESFRTHSNGVIETQAEIAKLPLPTDTGAWQLEVYAEDNPLTAASILFYNGYYNGREDLLKKPDQLTLTTDKEKYGIGETVNLSIQSKFDGPMTLYLANDDDIVETLHTESKGGQATISFVFSEDWVQGVWVLANGFDANGQAISKGVNKRAIGLGWVGLTEKTVALDLVVNTAAAIKPDSTLDVEIEVSNKTALNSGDTWVSVLAVDEGVYKMAAPTYHDPVKFFVGKERFDLSYLDTYGDIIKQIQARRGVVRSGAGDGEDGLGVQNIPKIDIEIVSLWSLPTKLDSEGKANVRLSVPSYNGKLRLIAVAWNAEKTGGKESFVEVAAPIVSQLSAPYFLSTGDEASMQVRLQNTTEAPLQVSYELSAQGEISLLDSGQKLVDQITLNAGQEYYLPAKIKALNAGHAGLSINIKSNDFEFSEKRDLTVREANLLVSNSRILRLQPGEQLNVNDSLPDWMMGAKSVKVVADQLGGFDPKSIAHGLAVYPYGCVEQTTSRVWPYLFADELDKRWGIKSPNNANEVLHKALIRLDNLQSSSGGFSLWGNDGYDLWLTAYVLDFYYAVEEKGQYSINLLSKNSALEWLRRRVNQYSFNSKVKDIQGVAYAYYILARAGEATPAEVRLLLNEINGMDTQNTLSVVHLSAALAYLGDIEAAQSGLANINEVLRSGEMYDYGSVLRDTAQAIVILDKLQQQFKINIATPVNNLRTNLTTSLFNKDYYQTQEMLWLLQLAAMLPKQSGDIELSINGKSYAKPGSVEQNEVYQTPFLIKNTGKEAIYVKTTIDGYFHPDKTFAAKMNADVSYYNQNGEPIDLSTLKLNDIVIAVVNFGFGNKDSGKRDLILAGLIPAGMSLEDGNALLMTENSTLSNTLRNRNMAYPEYKENRDDRHIAAFSLYPHSSHRYYHLFMMRAVRVGEWSAPGVAIEDMYDPNTRVQLPNMKVNISE